jgi:flagellar motor switch protein FliN
MTTAPVARPMLEGFVDSCRKAWADALSRVVGSACEIQILQETGALPSPAPICVVINAEGALSGQAAFLMDQRNAALLAAKCGGSAQAAQDAVRQAIVTAFNIFQKQFGATRAQFAPGAAPTWKPDTVLALVAASKGADAMRAYLLLSPQITGVEPAAPVQNAAPSASEEVISRPLPDRNLNLVMGVQLEVSLRFGQKRMPLKQLVELNAGSVVELDKRVHEPVELLLRDKVFARGEVVIVDGHYGLRVTEVCSNQEPL